MHKTIHERKMYPSTCTYTYFIQRYIFGYEHIHIPPIPSHIAMEMSLIGICTNYHGKSDALLLPTTWPTP